MVCIVFSYVLYGEFSGYPNEYDPSLIWRTTTSTSNVDCVISDIKWKDEDKQISDSQDVSLCIDNPSQLRKDDNIWAQCIVKSINEDNQMCKEPSGSARIQLSNVINGLNKTTSFVYQTPIYLSSVMDHGEKTPKGYISVTFERKKNPDLNLFKIVSLKGVIELDFEQHDRLSNKHTKIITELVDSQYYPYDLNKQDSDTGFGCTDQTTEKVRAPLYNDVVMTPGLYYWLQVGDYNNIEFCMKNIALITLKRCNIGEEAFNEIFDQQMSQRDSYYDENFTICAVALSRMICLISTSLYYKSDEVYVTEQINKAISNPFKTNFSDLYRKPIESFNDALLLECGDCEDLACLVHRMACVLEKGDPLLRIEGDPIFDKGSWNSPLLKRMQTLMHMYVCVGSLGTISGTKAKDISTDQDILMLIDSVESREADSLVGGHMWCELIPNNKFERMVNRTSPNSIPLRIFPNDEYHKWHDNLPHMVAEGTGLIHPLLRPFNEYCKATYNRNKFFDQKNIAECLQYVHSGGTGIFSVACYDQLPITIEDIPNSRYGNFYIKTSSVFTAKLINQGYNVGEFMTTYCSPRIDENKTSKNRNVNKGYKWKWGVEMRDKLTGYQDIGLVVTPGYTKDEWLLLESLSRQLPPPKYPYLSENGLTVLDHKFSPFLNDFNNKCRNITKNRKSNSESCYVFIVYSYEMFTSIIKEKKGSNMTISNHLCSIVQDRQRIKSCEAFLEIITETIINVRLDIHVYVV